VAFKIEGGLNPRHQPAGVHISSNATLTRKKCTDSRFGSPASFRRRLTKPANRLAGHRLVAQPLRLADSYPEQGPVLGFAATVRRFDIGQDNPFQVVLHGDSPALTPVSLKPQHVPRAFVLEISQPQIGPRPMLRALRGS
jgi:hypothetical protein